MWTKVNVSTVVNRDYQSVFDSVYRILNSKNYPITLVNMDARTMQFKTPMSLTSWGYRFTVTFNPNGYNQTQITFYGEHVYGFDIWGHGKKIVNSIINQL